MKEQLMMVSNAARLGQTFREIPHCADQDSIKVFKILVTQEIQEYDMRNAFLRVYCDIFGHPLIPYPKILWDYSEAFSLNAINTSDFQHQHQQVMFRKTSVTFDINTSDFQHQHL